MADEQNRFLTSDSCLRQVRAAKSCKVETANARQPLGFAKYLFCDLAVNWL